MVTTAVVLDTGWILFWDNLNKFPDSLCSDALREHRRRGEGMEKESVMQFAEVSRKIVKKNLFVYPIIPNEHFFSTPGGF
jgi:hypothetical protein